MASKCAASEQSQMAVERAGNSFSFRMFNQLAKENEGKNIFFSPYSITSAMSMVLLGSRGNTEAELKSGLGFRDVSDINQGNAQIRESLSQMRQGVTLDTANRLFPEKSYQLLAEFVSDCKKYYGSEVSPLDYVKNAEESRQFINNWVEKQTNEKIKDLIPGGSITSMTKLVLANAIYFKGNWLTEFNKKHTMEADFNVKEGKTAKVNMMSKKAKYKYTEDKNLGVKVLELPYKGKTTSMIIVLPNERFGLANVEIEIDSGKLQKIEESLSEQDVMLSLPKFKMEFGSDLVDTFRALGVTSIFGDKADFSGMSGVPDLYVSSIAHKAFVEVNEEGTEAAAATAVIMSRMMMPLPPPRFYCDHPFLFFIKHKPTNVILFAGRYVSPKY